MSILWLIPAAMVVAVPFTKWIERRAIQEPGQEEKEEGEGAAPGEILEILSQVYTKLRRAGASCRPWIHDCIVAIEAGQGCGPEIAIAALTETGEDLAGSRWDTDEMAETFGKAAEKLAAMI